MTDPVDSDLGDVLDGVVVDRLPPGHRERMEQLGDGPKSPVATQFERTLETAERDATCARMRSAGMTFAQIGAQVGLAESSVRAAVKRALRAAVAEPAEELRDLELDRLDTLWRTALGIMAKEHPLVSNGRVMKDPDGKTLPDDMPKLAAIDRLLKIQDRRAKLMGLDAPVKADLRVSDGVDRNIERFAEELGIMASIAAASESGFAEEGGAGAS